MSVITQKRTTNEAQEKKGLLSRIWSGRKAKRLYQVMWRWHFFMGLFITPFLIIVSVAGSLYVFKDELEPLMYPTLMFVEEEPSSQTIAASEALAAVQAAYPDYEPSGFTIDRDPTRAWSVRITGADDESTNVYLNQFTGEILGDMSYQSGFFGVVLRIHRQLFIGTPGRVLVETSTAWGIVSIITGLFLWWPRGRDKIRGVLTLRLNKSRKVFWRDLHSVPAFYLAIFAVLIMFTGMLYTLTGQYTILGTGLALGQLPDVYLNPPHSTVVEGAEPIGVDAAISRFDEMTAIDHFYLVVPTEEDGAYTFNANLDQNFSQARLIYIDQYSGETLTDVRWDDLTLFTKGILYFYPIHTGGIFGLPTKILAFITCWIIVLMSISGVVMWWLRKPAGSWLGAPRPAKNAVIPRIVTALTILLALILPMVAVTLLLIFLFSGLEWLYKRQRVLRHAEA